MSYLVQNKAPSSFVLWSLSLMISCGTHHSKSPDEHTEGPRQNDGPPLTELPENGQTSEGSNKEQLENPESPKNSEQQRQSENAAQKNLQLLNGSWTSSCTNDQEAASSEQAVISFGLSQRSVVLEVRVFNDFDCKSHEMESTFSMRANFSGGTASSEVESAYHINYKIVEITMAMHGAVVKTANKRRFCGLQGWQDAEAKDITGLRCRRLGLDNPAAGELIYDIFAVNAQTAQFGLDRKATSEERNGSNPDKRPNTLAPIIFQRS